ncbi:hypothetical protein NEUTE2DRAFT_59733 [Neurospora tetrasperma FGSC 2509]|nr:hypothetical protein NEUTE2DRAFT_59733 [Neurospora tetrasperma FGSC 2509]
MHDTATTPGSQSPDSSFANLDSLGNHIYLEKQDKLRDLGINLQTSQKLRETLRAFRHELTDFRPEDVAGVIEKANMVMEIRSGINKDILSLPMFSDDILKIEISSPDNPHLTVIDVPGLFQVTDQYCELTVQFSDGEETYEERENHSLSNLVMGTTLKLGYFVVRNRGADEDDLDISQCNRKEVELFEDPQWKDIASTGRVGVDTLRKELQSLLTGLAKRELPKQKAEVIKRLADCEKRSISYGPPRSTPAAQREHLIKLALRFERLVNDALEGLYGRDVLFGEKPPLKLITKIIELNEGFSNAIWKKGQTWNFKGKTTEKDNGAEAAYIKLINEAFDWASTFPELLEYRHPNIVSFKNPQNDIMAFIGECYSASRGPELGSFGGSVLTMAFQAQATSWDEAATRHVKGAVLVIHRFLYTLLEVLVADQRMREELWSSLQDDLLKGYRRACDHAKFVINTELNGRPVTYNHYFNDNLQRARLGRQRSILQGLDANGPNTKVDLSKVQALMTSAVENKSNAEQVKEDIHDILKSYYKVARKRFVDNICQQAINHFLLDGDQSPVKIFTANWVAKLNDRQLNSIAGEDATTTTARQRLETEIEGLKKALEVLRY